MRVFWNCMSTNLRQAIFSLRFLVSLLITTLLYFASGYYDLQQYWDVPLMDVLSFYDFLHNVGSFESMLVLCAVLPFSTTFYEDWKNRYIRFSIVRSGYKNYSIPKVAACALSGGLVIALGIFLFIMILAMRFPLVNTTSGVLESYIGSYNSNMSAGTVNYPFLSAALVNGNYLLFYVGSIYLVFLFGAFWSVVSLCISAYIPNLFVSTFSPFILLFLEGLIFAFAPAWLRTSILSKGFWSVGKGLFINFAYVTLFFGILIVALGFLFHFAIRRRIQDEFH